MKGIVVGNDGILLPIRGTKQVYISSPYGQRSSGFHKGIDLVYKQRGEIKGAEIIAPLDGTVIQAVDYEDGDGGGVRVMIKDSEGNYWGFITCSPDQTLILLRNLELERS